MLRTENEAIFIDRKRKTVTIRQSSEDTYEESYDKLVISTGASPVTPPSSRNRPKWNFHTKKCHRHRSDQRIYQEPRSAKSRYRRSRIYRSGNGGKLTYTGSESVDCGNGQSSDGSYHFSMASLVHQHLMDKGVNLYLEQAVASFSREEKD